MIRTYRIPTKLIHVDRLIVVNHYLNGRRMSSSQLVSPKSYLPALEPFFNEQVSKHKGRFEPGSRPVGFFGGFNTTISGTPPDKPTSRVHQSTSRINNKPFKKRVRKGEMVVSDYHIFNRYMSYTMGSIESSRRPGGRFRSKGNLGEELLMSEGLGQGTWSPANKEYYLQGYPSYDGVAVHGNFEFETEIVSELTGYHPEDYGWPSDYLEGISLPFFSDSEKPDLLAKANSGTFDLLTFLAELPETLKYVLSIIQQIAKITQEFKRREIRLYNQAKKGKNGLVKQTKELLTALADLRLQYRYAIMPNVYTIQDIGKTFDTLGKEYIRTRDRFFKTEDFVKTLTVPPGWEITSHSGDHIERLFIKSQVDVSTVLTNLSSLLATNIASTAWELVPYSFVVDWFLPIGDYIRNLTSFGSAIKRVSTQSIRNQMTVVFSSQVIDGMKVTVSFDDYLRSVYNSFECEGFDYNVILNMDQSLDALALSWQHIRRLI